MQHRSRGIGKSSFQVQGFRHKNVIKSLHLIQFNLVWKIIACGWWWFAATGSGHLAESSSNSSIDQSILTMIQNTVANLQQKSSGVGEQGVSIIIINSLVCFHGSIHLQPSLWSTSTRQVKAWKGGTAWLKISPLYERDAHLYRFFIFSLNHVFVMLRSSLDNFRT